MFSFLKNLFNAPPFGLYITDKYVQVVQLSGNPANPQVKSAGQRPLPNGFVQNGELLQEKALAQEINALLASCKPHKISGKRCIVAISESQIFEHIFYLPPELKGHEFQDRVKQLIQETIPVSFNELKYNYYTHEVSKTQIVFVATMRRLVLAQYYEVIKALCKLNPVVFEPESLSLLRNIPLNFDVDHGIIVVDIRDDKLNWFTTWSENIFDNSSICKSEIQADLSALINELKDAKQTFEKESKRKISSVVVSGNKTEAQALVEPLKTALGIPVSVVENYKLAIPGIESEKIKVVGGLALKGLGQDIKTNLNFLDKL